MAEWRNRFFCRVGPSGGRGTVSGCVPGPMTSSKMDAVKPDPLAEGGRSSGWWEGSGLVALRNKVRHLFFFFPALRVPAPLCVCAPLIVLTGKIRHFYFSGIFRLFKNFQRNFCHFFKKLIFE